MAIIENEMNVTPPESPRQTSSTQALKDLFLPDLLGMLSPQREWGRGYLYNICLHAWNGKLCLMCFRHLGILWYGRSLLCHPSQVDICFSRDAYRAHRHFPGLTTDTGSL